MSKLPDNQTQCRAAIMQALDHIERIDESLQWATTPEQRKKLHSTRWLWNERFKNLRAHVASLDKRERYEEQKALQQAGAERRARNIAASHARDSRLVKELKKLVTEEQFNQAVQAVERAERGIGLVPPGNQLPVIGFLDTNR